MIEFKGFNGKVYMIVTDAKLLSMPFRNFEGRKSDFNPMGEREFGVIIEDPELAQQMAQNNWNVKTITNRDGREYLYGVKVDGDDIHWVKIKVKYRRQKTNEPLQPPTILINTYNKQEVEYSEEDIKELDTADLMDVDLKINVSEKVINGKQMTIGYLNRMKATMIDDNYWFGSKNDGGNESDPPFDI